MNNLPNLTKLIRYYILTSTTASGSGHPTSSLSATELMTSLFFNDFFQVDLDNPKNPENDRLIFSKGHASPLFYALYATAGKVSYENLLTLRKFGSNLEGHPTMDFPYTEAATGSLGQGLGVGVGMAIASKMQAKSNQKLREFNTFVLMGDSEIAEGSVWESAQLASYYKLDNLVGIVDVNRLGQRGETMFGWEMDSYKAKFEAFGWETFVVDGQNLEEVNSAYTSLLDSKNSKPKMILAKTKKGAGISFLENQDNWHGKALSKELLEDALAELGLIDTTLIGKVKAL